MSLFDCQLHNGACTVPSPRTGVYFIYWNNNEPVGPSIHSSCLPDVFSQFGNLQKIPADYAGVSVDVDDCESGFGGGDCKTKVFYAASGPREVATGKFKFGNADTYLFSFPVDANFSFGVYYSNLTVVNPAIYVRYPHPFVFCCAY